MAKKPFEVWFKEVDAIISRKFGVGVDDLPDMDYVSMHEDGVSPKSAAARAVKNAE